ncbi:branched-chain amino acid aminotransferase [Pseudomonas sp. B21-040]|jgi:branched-chain amino acid aminotransferase|uniref:Branched-chain-amino-acid aminotransferase n=1 Tax=Pseudomonas fluorescens TaxID=294 RepID=A0A5E7KQC7_PSEFL|nr:MULTISPECIES: branched-chain amino acid aminotransferase [Pseudomonas]EJM12653.1 branched-chain amino acid aminotransferase, group II [Pseudomonas sp. GM21]KJZ35617.1 branched-chain amino acid aminotransferase [Pseudomonas fluorescens]MDR6928771.1 branched-chain amino acid aminotransferase [Pseudomonas sp. BE134]MDR7284318.1 branched-chain amino acid aminotransferase [Pseudomonas corrugata]OOG15103.1 branched chain amino acid aminotransferase [Pseudomonas sp. C9]
MGNESINWDKLGFDYIKTDKRFLSYWRNGEWDKGTLTEDNVLHISEGSTALHYGQQCFEGMKAYRCKDGSINLFRPDQNALRMQRSCARLLMPFVETEQFIEACKAVVRANERFIPPYGTGGALYLRPFVIGVGDNIGVRTAPEFIFSIFAIPVGAYFKGGLTPHNFLISSFDRAAPQGTGAAKVGGNYAASLMPGSQAKKAHYADCIYLDPMTHTKIEEVGSANFFGITHDNKFVTPNSPSVLPGITRLSLIELAKSRLGLEVIEGDVFIDKLSDFKEAGACGTAAVITPIGGISYNDHLHVFHSETEVGPVTQKLYKELTGVQTGDIEAPAGWIVKV